MGHSFDMLTFDFLLKPPQPITGLFFDIGWVVDKVCVYTIKGQKCLKNFI